MPQKRVYVDTENHKYISGLMKSLKENKTVQSMNIRVDQNFAVSVLCANAKIPQGDAEAIEIAIRKFLEKQKNDGEND